MRLGVLVRPGIGVVLLQTLAEYRLPPALVVTPRLIRKEP